MIGFAEVIAEVVADLTGAGVKATADSTAVRFPGIWVGGIEAVPSTLGGEWDYTVDLYLVDTVAGDMRAYASLDELASEVLQLWPLADDRKLEVTSVNLPSQPTVPAYRFPIIITH